LYALTLAGKKQDVANIPLSGVLRKKSDYKHAIKILDELNFPLHEDGPKNWDCLAALSLIQRYLPNKSAKVLDAGGEFYSPILRQLELSGYTDLTCINLVFKDRFTSRYLKKGNIMFEYGDITKTRFANGYFDAITCLSVIEHGVDIELYFKEMSRLLRVNGVLFTSTDYWEQPIATGGKVAYGVPVKIFDPNDINEMIRIAERHGFKIIEPIAFDCDQKVVTWKEFNLRYTFIYFALMKVK
jgi:SAM-dependent methyltransferase